MLPQDRAFEIAFGNTIEIVLGDQNAVARQDLRAPRIIESLDLPAFLVARAEFDQAAHIGVRVDADQEGIAEIVVMRSGFAEDERGGPGLEPIIPSVFALLASVGAIVEG